MEKSILNTESLIELHEELNEFAKHHQNKGGQKAHQLIKRELIEKNNQSPKDGSERGLVFSEGYDYAMKSVLSLLHKEFVP